MQQGFACSDGQKMPSVDKGICLCWAGLSLCLSSLWLGLRITWDCHCFLSIDSTLPIPCRRLCPMLSNAHGSKNDVSLFLGVSIWPTWKVYGSGLS